MALITKQILRFVSEFIGAPIEQTETQAQVDLRNINGTLPIVPDLGRRAAVIGTQTGWFQGILENVHSGADGERSEIDPYSAGADAVAPYPPAIDDTMDLWLLGCNVVQSVGAGTLLTEAMILINPAPNTQGFGRDDAGAPVIAVRGFVVARFTSVVNAVTDLAVEVGITAEGLPYQPVNMRLARGSTISFSSEASAAAEFQAVLTMGLFPAALGQDVVT